MPFLSMGLLKMPLLVHRDIEKDIFSYLGCSKIRLSQSFCVEELQLYSSSQGFSEELFRSEELFLILLYFV